MVNGTGQTTIQDLRHFAAIVTKIRNKQLASTSSSICNCFIRIFYLTMDRAGLVRRRQQIREKENVDSEANILLLDSANSVVKKKKKTIKPKGTPSTSETTVNENVSAPMPPPPPAKKSSKQSKTTYTTELNAGLVVRQILQHSQFKDVKEYLQSTTKQELFQQAFVVATYVQELKKKHTEVADVIGEELIKCQKKYHCVSSDLAERERIYEEQNKEKKELLGRLELAQEEYQSLIVWIREKEDQFKALQQTKKDQAQLIEEISKTRRQREERLSSVENEREQAFRYAEELQEQNTKLQAQVTMVERDCKKIQVELKEEHRTNKQLMLEVQRKSQALEHMSSELENARSEISTLQGQVQLEAISRHSITQERDRLQQQYQADRQNWKSTQEHHDTFIKRKADEFRAMDLELRQLNQSLSRMRIEWESEKSQHEKAEIRLQKLSTFLDETRSHTQALEEESQQLKMQLNGEAKGCQCKWNVSIHSFVSITEEKEARTSKDHALQLAHRDLQTLQKSYREQENAKLDAQSEVTSLVQRMKIIRRDHLALLHRVETPNQLATQWHANIQANEHRKT
ncbi:Peripheral-type benzodiazepine receptor-associated protein 1 [Phytophthora citrophthora]|uniref:Peripheral-type benzodiazepine receptor-associated protein 1 n=1 Tax=Phytophthora citrophthora TaxID=4793 RepID=A0AAD9LN59_9STRA|nr:Peripheral-type benzodiazepine receptor-associated protein 1 [Phytophthora citrophthora]